MADAAAREAGRLLVQLLNYLPREMEGDGSARCAPSNGGRRRRLLLLESPRVPHRHSCGSHFAANSVFAFQGRCFCIAVSFTFLPLRLLSSPPATLCPTCLPSSPSLSPPTLLLRRGTSLTRFLYFLFLSIQSLNNLIRKNVFLPQIPFTHCMSCISSSRLPLLSVSLLRKACNYRSSACNLLSHPLLLLMPLLRLRLVVEATATASASASA